LANCDALFDNGLISFDSTGELFFSSKMSAAARKIFGIAGRSLAKKPDEKTAAYFAFHGEHVFQE
jgi:hypothetical protein